MTIHLPLLSEILTDRNLLRCKVFNVSTCFKINGFLADVNYHADLFRYWYIWFGNFCFSYKWSTCGLDTFIFEFGYINLLNGNPPKLLVRRWICGLAIGQVRADGQRTIGTDRPSFGEDFP